MCPMFLSTTAYEFGRLLLWGVIRFNFQMMITYSSVTFQVPPSPGLLIMNTPESKHIISPWIIIQNSDVFLVLEIIFWPILSLLAKILSYEKITSKVQHLFVSWSTRKVPAFLACGYKKYPNICGSEFPWHEQAFSFLFNQYFTFDWKSFHLIPLN